ncbi:major facilitator superfamily MFS_1 [Halalkaliarchaeum desulfuricum]|uniref:Major facilitator superfamily MFS_1 n=1 Tax=Halalkaliarchaeum desulfuricum TaxID=2055893 RepID=A0A343TM35_9EURY|nr:MFS transporter [Halalkaliarchaeum desulfuricum]AUX10157.1 major facilitator superfamily MFS_1 [Halalkaliarchaeum desulfuricum]
MTSKDYPKKRWTVLGLAWGAFFAVAMAWYIMPTLQPDILELYGITGSQFQLAFTLPFGVAAVLCIPGGMLADRLGIRRAATLGMAISGVGFLLRSRTGSFEILLGSMLLVGVGLGLVMPNLPKLVSVWFPSDETGLATGIYNTGLMGGLSTGMVIAPFLPAWQSGNVLLGGIVLAFAVVFFVIVRDTPPGKELPSTPLVEGLQRAVKSKNAWVAGFAVFAGLAGMVAIQGELPVALFEIHGIDTATGGQIASMITYGGILGSLTIPAIATKLDRRKGTLVSVAVGFGVIMFPVWLTGNTTILFVGTTVAGYLAGGALPIIMEVPTWLPRVESDPVEPQHVGGASGLMTAMMNLGGFIGLPFIIGPIIGWQGYTIGLLAAMIIFSFQGILGILFTLPELGD